jgi:hypothetical protein
MLHRMSDSLAIFQKIKKRHSLASKRGKGLFRDAFVKFIEGARERGESWALEFIIYWVVTAIIEEQVRHSESN